MNKFSLSALVAAGVLAGGFATSASAADLGGNCCADLEERIAELEATTARKGNRKVSLTVSGWVNQQITFWDDGEESNVYIHDLGTTLGSHVKFTGQATISPGYSAGYVLHIEAMGSDGLMHDQDNNSGPMLYNALAAGQPFAAPAPGLGRGNGVQTLQSYWFVKSDTLGKVSVGLQSQASDNTAILVDGSGSLISANWVAFDTRSFFMQIKGGGPDRQGLGRWGLAQGCADMGGVWGDCNGLTQSVVRYDSPTFAGFSVSASWGEDDMWDIAARYSGEFNGVKVAIAGAYNEVTGQTYNNLIQPSSDYFQLGVYVQHVPTGLFGLFNYGNYDETPEAGDAVGFLSTFAGKNAETYYFKGGVRTRLNALGHTVFYGEYLRGDDGGNLVSNAAFGTGATSSQMDVWGLGVVQEVDAAAMSVWLKYRNLSYEDNNDVGVEYEDFDYVGLGAIINF